MPFTMSKLPEHAARIQPEVEADCFSELMIFANHH